MDYDQPRIPLSSYSSFEARVRNPPMLGFDNMNTFRPNSIYRCKLMKHPKTTTFLKYDPEKRDFIVNYPVKAEEFDGNLLTE